MFGYFTQCEVCKDNGLEQHHVCKDCWVNEAQQVPPMTVLRLLLNVKKSQSIQEEYERWREQGYMIIKR